MRHRLTAAWAPTLVGLTLGATVLSGCSPTSGHISPTESPTTSAPLPSLSPPTRGVVPAKAVIKAPGTSGTLTVTIRSVEAVPGATIVTWAMRWDDPDMPAAYRGPVGYFSDGDAKPPLLVDRTTMQVHYPLCPDGSWTGDNPAVCGYDGLYSPSGHDSIRLANRQTLEAWAVFSEIGPDTQTVDLTMPAGLLTPGGVLSFAELPVTRAPPPEPEPAEVPDDPADTPKPAAPASTQVPVPVEVTVDAPGGAGTLTITVTAATAFDTATVVPWTIRWDNPDTSDGSHQEMSSVINGNTSFVPTLTNRPAMQVYRPLCTVNNWHASENKPDSTNCAYAGLFAPNDHDRAKGIRLINHQTITGWATFPPVGDETTTVDLLLPHTLPAFFGLPVTRAEGAPTATGNLGSALVDLQVTDEMRAQATQGIDPAGTVFPLTRNDGGVISLSTDLLFETGATDLTDSGRSALGDLAGQLPQGAAVAVGGHTDSVMDEDTNILLSRAQAQAVADALAAVRPDLTLTVIGHGSSSPVASNSNPNGTDIPIGRQLNRRVTLG